MSTGFPKFSHSAKQGELGTNLVSRVISDNFGWLFKRNHQEHDFGIDGQIEVVTPEGAVTGQMIAVQVKCGKTFFKEQNKRGYVYRRDTKHFNYLANYPITSDHLPLRSEVQGELLGAFPSEPSPGY